VQSNFARVAVVVVAIAAVIALFVVLGGDDDSDETTTQATQTTSVAEEGGQQNKSDEDKAEKPAEEIPRIVVVGGQPQGGVQELEFTAGGEVRFEVVSDIAEHVHVHGYDVIQDVEPGKPVVFAFPADIEGVFEVELEDSATQIAELTVNPG
jgi:hypothetical protein